MEDLMKKLTLFTLLLAVACGLVFAGGQQDVQAATSQASSIATPSGTFPLVTEKITMTIAVRQDPKIEDLATNQLTLEYEEMTNVHIEWDILPNGGNAMEQKINLLLATNSGLPDIFLNANIRPAKQVIYGMNQKVFVPLDGLIAEHGPNITTMLDYRPEIRKMATAPDGHIYAIPAIAEAYHTQTPVRMWMNGAWLDKLGLEVPTTLDEFYNVLKAFKEKDPNGNGLADEIPLTGAITGWGTKVVHYFMLPFIYSGPEVNQSWTFDGNKVGVPFNTPEWREGLRYLNKLYSEELLDPAAFTQKVGQLRKLTENPNAWVVGAATAGAPGGMSNSNSERSNQYVPVPPLTGPEGIQRSAYKPFGYSEGKFVVTNQCEYPDIAVRWIDWFASREGSLRARAGVMDEHWRWAQTGELGVNGKQGVYYRLLKFGKVQNVHWNKNTPDFYPDELRNGMVSENDPEAMLYDITEKYYIDHIPEKAMLPFFMTPEESEEYDELSFLLNQYVQESYARFTMGDLDINNDSHWQDYLEELENIGIGRYLEIAQKGYASQYGN